MKTLIGIGSLRVFAVVTMTAADQTGTGKISDSMCGTTRPPSMA